jgi:diadenylate cyclase
MTLVTILFLNIRLLDVLDILLVAYLFYMLYHLIKGTVAIRIFVGIASIYLLWKLVKAFQMEMLGEILGQFIGVGVIALIIVFQQELRKFLLMLGSTGWNKIAENSYLSKWFGKELLADEAPRVVQALVRICTILASSKTGGLIIVENKSDVMLQVQNADVIDAVLSVDLLQSIFHKESPMHDGAAVVIKDRIHAVRGVLPISSSTSMPKEFGMRHRSAVGISEVSDAIAIAISEENGGISIAESGKLKVDVSLKVLEKSIRKALG